MSGRLPALEGFALPSKHPLDRYQRAYYQSAVQVDSTAPGRIGVRVNTKVRHVRRFDSSSLWIPIVDFKWTA